MSLSQVRMLWYEELANDRTGQIKALADFLGYFLTQQQFEMYLYLYLYLYLCLYLYLYL